MKQIKPPKKEEAHHSLMEIAGEKAEAIKGGLIERKNKIISAAEEKFDSVKKAIHNLTAASAKQKTIKKAAVKKAVAKVAKKITKKK